MIVDFDSVDTLLNIINSQENLQQRMKPSDWAEKYRYMTTAVSAYEGPYSFYTTPYWREVLDTISPDHPAKRIAVMKGAQVGASTGLIENGIGYKIAQSPGPMCLLAGTGDLAKQALTLKVDNMIDTCGIRHLIKSNSKSGARNGKTGDTSKEKEFAGGRLLTGAAGNHKAMRQNSFQVIFADDLDNAKKADTESGDTMKMFEQRGASYFEHGGKIYYISTPETKINSLIEPAFEMGDQRYYNIPCPCCNEMIVLKWEIFVGEDKKNRAGITWKLNNKGEIIDNSVGYVCQKCSGFFNDRKKMNWLNDGGWFATAKAKKPDFWSYHLSSLYAPKGMFDWRHYVYDFMDANPPGAEQDVEKNKTFVNLCLGLTSDDKSSSIKSLQIQNNTRNYEIDTVPNVLSQEDGNGAIVYITLACDLNGKEHDARLDYEILAHTITGATYSVDHGSIGTFIPLENQRKEQVERQKWNYYHGEEFNIWSELDVLLDKIYKGQDGKEFTCIASAIDTGAFTSYANAYIEKRRLDEIHIKGYSMCFGMKGEWDKESANTEDKKDYKKGQAQPYLWISNINKVKDKIAVYTGLKWSKSEGVAQPHNFMNFPIPDPTKDKYTHKGYFQTYESEHKKIKKAKYIWVKKHNKVMNHFWDCRVYGLTLPSIITCLLAKELDLPNEYHTICEYLLE